MKNSTLAITMKILFKFPSRSRPEKFFKAIENIQTMVADKENYLIQATLDISDHTMANCHNRLNELKNVEINWGHSRSKIDAVNRDVTKEYAWDILIATSDDMEFIKSGFDDDIRKAFVVEDSLDRVLWVRDGYDHDPIISLPILGREWYNTYGYIYHPQYISLFCDEELYLVASQLNKLIPSDLVIVKHQHPTWIGGPVDSLLRSTEKFHPIDKMTFDKRKRNNFFIK